MSVGSPVYHSGHTSKYAAIPTVKQRDVSRPLTDLGSVCVTGAHFERAPSVTYSWLQNCNPITEDRFRRNCLKALQMDIMDNQWKNLCILTHKHSISAKMQETAYKLQTNWYTTPAKLNVWNPQTPSICWRCGSDTGVLINIWWHCPRLVRFWNQVREIIKKITGTKLLLNGAYCLLHISNFPLKRYKKIINQTLAECG